LGAFAAAPEAADAGPAAGAAEPTGAGTAAVLAATAEVGFALAAFVLGAGVAQACRIRTAVRPSVLGEDSPTKRPGFESFTRRSL
jgi:hypothetical protein